MIENRILIHEWGKVYIPTVRINYKEQVKDQFIMQQDMTAPKFHNL